MQNQRIAAVNGENSGSANGKWKRGGGKSGKVPFQFSTLTNMSNANPELVITSLMNPNVKNYRGLRNLIRKTGKN